ncbi:hypothetical protein E2C01_018998 [Portunus trituberculatus]|uniref:Uncharacterized protein n=1 Tax=Portunus trituberculatus TaxID=210409 RepID=A0A5B7DX43_PORTR|nr:hypothetical protein [Portunus trituberculatus]
MLRPVPSLSSHSLTSSPHSSVFPLSPSRPPISPLSLCPLIFSSPLHHSIKVTDLKGEEDLRKTEIAFHCRR